MLKMKEFLNNYPRVKQMARKMVSVVPLSKRLGRDFWEWYSFFEESEQWTVDQLRQFQVERIRLLLSELLRSSLVSRHTRTKGRVVESAGIRFYRKRSGPDRWNNHPWSGSGGGRQGTEPLPALGTARLLGLKNGNCLDTYELLNSTDKRVLSEPF